MIRHFKIFLIFLVLNTMIASIYLVWGVIRSSEKGQWKNYLFKAEVMLFCPGIGPMFFLVSNLIYKIFFRKAVDLADVIFSKERVTTFKRADIEAEGNLVPIEEALVVSDKGSQRALLLKVARGDIHNSLASISLALNSDDSETAHYAAAVLQDALNDFRLRVQELYEHMQEDEEDAPEYAALMIEYMNNMLSQGVFDELEQKKYVGMMEEAGEVLYQKAKEKLTAVYIECICLRLLQSEEYNRMEVWCERSKELHPDVLSTYTLQLKLYFTIQDKQKFFQVLNALKQSDIVIDRDTLALIRAFYESDSGKTKETVTAASKDNAAENKGSGKENKESDNRQIENKQSKNRECRNPKSDDIKKSDSRINKLETVEEISGTADMVTDVLTVATTVASAAAEIAENVKEDATFADVEILNAVDAVKSEESKESQSIVETPKPEMPEALQSAIEEAEPEVSETLQNIIEESKPEASEVLQDIVETKKSEESKALQRIFEEIAQEEAAQRKSEEAALTKFMVSNVIDDLISENAVTEDINAQISHIIEELITESEAREKEEAALQQVRQIHESRISDKKKIDVLKTIARKHKIWTWLGLGLVIASACLIIYMKNKKSKEE